MTDMANQKDQSAPDDKYLWQDPLREDNRFKDRMGNPASRLLRGHPLAPCSPAGHLAMAGQPSFNR